MKTISKIWGWIKKYWFIPLAIIGGWFFHSLFGKTKTIVDPGEKPKKPDPTEDATDYVSKGKRERGEVDAHVHGMDDRKLLDAINRDYGSRDR